MRVDHPTAAYSPAPLPDAIRNPLADVTACPTCGHLIAGLPPMGACPECGAEYDRHEVVLFGRPRWHLWNAYSGAFTSLLFFGAYVGGRSWIERTVTIVYGLSLAGALVAAISRLTVERPGQARLRLSRAGVGLDVETPPPPILLRALVVVCAAVGVRRKWWTTDPWTRSATIPWYRVRQVWITPAGGDRSRIRVRRSGYRTGKAVPIDMTTSAPPEQLDALRAYTDSFIQAGV